MNKRERQEQRLEMVILCLLSRNDKQPNPRKDRAFAKLPVILDAKGELQSQDYDELAIVWEKEMPSYEDKATYMAAVCLYDPANALKYWFDRLEQTFSKELKEKNPGLDTILGFILGLFESIGLYLDDAVASEHPLDWQLEKGFVWKVLEMIRILESAKMDRGEEKRFFDHNLPKDFPNRISDTIKHAISLKSSLNKKLIRAIMGELEEKFGQKHFPLAERILTEIAYAGFNTLNIRIKLAAVLSLIDNKEID